MYSEGCLLFLRFVSHMAGTIITTRDSALSEAQTCLYIRLVFDIPNTDWDGLDPERYTREERET